jgi:hypothetical protein
MIVSKERNSKMEIDLTGPQGNAFNLIGVAKRLSKTLGLDADKIVGEMTSGDYDKLVTTFDNYFGEIVILYK